MWPVLLAAVALADVDQVAHRGAWSDGSVRWEGRWRADTLVSRVPFATPLPAGAQWLSTDGRVERDADGRIVAVAYDPPRSAGRWELVLPQRVDAPVLAVPLVDEPAVQQVILVGLDFTPSDDLAFEKHVRYWAPAELAGPEERRFNDNRHAGGWPKARPGDQPVYLRADARLGRAGGIPGHLSPEGQVSWLVQGVLVAAGVGVLAFGAVLYRSLETAERRERNAAYIRENFTES